MKDLITVNQLYKHYKGVTAVDGISMSISPGSCFGLLGPNGAGKTTTVEMLEGILTPNAGEILYRGQPLDASFRQHAGIMFQSTALQDFITVRESLQLFSELYPRTVPMEQLIADCSLEDYIDRDANKLSGGQRQRLLLAMALVNDPDMIFLDEPTTGLDPQARRNFWSLVQRIKQQGKTILLTTHYMEEAYVLCDQIAIMDHGKIIARGSPKALLADYFEDVVLQLPLSDFPQGTEGLPFKVTLHHEHEHENVEIISNDVDTTVSQLREQGISLKRLQIRQRTLEDLFLALTGKGLRT
ncbi:MAG: ABC transporter ATP-binding protein [Ectothiorhodospiraceae bacterium]|nr:ABC transporter ATP-binding protein [Ectothiorhodospiraceae bacterium]